MCLSTSRSTDVVSSVPLVSTDVRLPKRLRFRVKLLLPVVSGPLRSAVALRDEALSESDTPNPTPRLTPSGVGLVGNPSVSKWSIHTSPGTLCVRCTSKGVSENGVPAPDVETSVSVLGEVLVPGVSVLEEE